MWQTQQIGRLLIVDVDLRYNNNVLTLALGANLINTYLTH